MKIHQPTKKNWQPGIIRILAAEDEQPHRDLLAEIFDSNEFSIHFAINGRIALQMLNNDEYDVVLLDNNMPEMQGLEVLHHIRQNPATSLLPVIMITALNSHYDLERGLKNGADDFLGKPYSPIELIARVRSAAQRKWTTDQLDNAESILFALAHLVEARDPTTGHHCARLAHISQAIGKELQLPREDLTALRRGAILHDIGKLVVPDAILSKNGPLTPDEREIMSKHAIIGAELCKGLATVRPAMPIIRHHHERFDGKGYPDGLSGENIPLLARLFQVVDIFDALYNKRPYKEALPLPQCLAILQQGMENGTSDPDLTRIFIQMATTNPACLQPTLNGSSEGESIYQSMEASGMLKGTRFDGSENPSLFR
ncbi:MAG: response regulator [Magnetococcales bacterium]|nr:response regulator [Magnetococcales bacterium]NGZ26016.1 response regulator [Magnetococcales bacterium]